MAESFQRRIWKAFRKGFRWFRILCLLLVLSIVVMAIYVTQVGLPGFAKAPLLRELKKRGLEAEYSRIRYSWFRGIVAEQIEFGPRAGQAGPQLRIEEAELRLNNNALRRRRFEVDSLVINSGTVHWTVRQTNGVTSQLTLSGITSELIFQPDDEWYLKSLTARFHDVRLKFSGSIRHAPELKNWKFARTGPDEPPVPLEQILARIAEQSEKVEFSGFPDLVIQVDGDAADPRSFRGHLRFSVPEIQTPWASGRDVLLSASLKEPLSDGPLPRIEVELESQRVEAKGLKAKNIRVTGVGQPLFSEPVLTNVTFHVETAGLETGHGTFAHGAFDIEAAVVDWPTKTVSSSIEGTLQRIRIPQGSADRVEFKARAVHPLRAEFPSAATLQATLSQVVSEHGGAEEVKLGLQLLDRQTAPPSVDESWGPWQKLAPHPFAFLAEAHQVKSPKLQVNSIQLGGEWKAPQLTLTNLQSKLYGGELKAEGLVDVATRRAGISVTSSFDILQVEKILTEGGRDWLKQFSWATPPRGRANLSVVLPAWNDEEPDWRGEVRPTLVIDGQFTADHAAFRKIPFDSATGNFHYSNMVWTLPDLHARRPEGDLFLEHQSSDLTKDYFFKIRSGVNPKIIRPLFDHPRAQTLFDEIQFTEPPSIEGEIRGRWRDYDRLRGGATITARNLSFRGERADLLTGKIDYRDQILRILEGRAERKPVEFGTAPEIIINLSNQTVSVRDGVARWNPPSFARMIGPQVVAALEPYRFGVPPAVKADGSIGFRNIDSADFRFFVQGEQFSWQKFNAQAIKGNIAWKGHYLALTNLEASAYRGAWDGWADFHFPKNLPGADFRFGTHFKDVQLQPLLVDVSGKSNEISGVIRGRAVINKGNTSDPKTWDGTGRFSLADGWIWEIPVFDLFGPLGTIDEGKGTFTIKNGFVESDDISFRSPSMWIRYKGKVGFDGSIDARAEGELMRSLPVLGRVISLLAKPFGLLFEIKIEGTLAQPTKKPLHMVTKVILSPFKALGNLKDALTPDDEDPPLPPPPDPPKPEDSPAPIPLPPQ